MKDNNKIDWKRKLSSRKFWVAVAGFVTSLMVAFGCTDSEITQATGIIMSGATMIAYIVGEGLNDFSRNKLPKHDVTYIEETNEFPKYDPNEN